MRKLIPLVLLSISLLCHGQEPSAPKPYATPPPGKISLANKKRLTPHIDRIARQYHIEPALIHAVISAESGYNPNAVSSAGAIGLMQVLPGTADDYGVKHQDLYDPITNITTGTRHLRRLLIKYKNISHSLAAYNAGEGTSQRYRRAVPYLETRKYVVRVIKYYQYYKAL